MHGHERHGYVRVLWYKMCRSLCHSCCLKLTFDKFFYANSHMNPVQMLINCAGYLLDSV